MKINNLTNGLVATLILASPMVGAETEYPAADFKPKVIYQDEASVSGQSKSAPAKELAKQEKSAEIDSKYPAADFEPKVLYKDADYKPSKFTGTPSASESATTADSALNVSVKVEEQSMMSYLLGLVVFAVAGYIFFGKREKEAKVSASTAYSAHVSGLSGVARYLRKHNMVAATGVARYLESQVVSEKETEATSGVEKYLEKQAKSAKEQAATGVEKYMRNRG